MLQFIGMKKILIYLLILVLGISALLFFINNHKQITDGISLVPPTQVDKSNAQFEWVYESKDEKDGIPQTNISLVAHYSDGTTEKKLVDDIEGGCNEYSNPDKDAYPGSKMIICYYAGFGRYYKVVQSADVYLVQRKEFEEASPDYNPPIQSFQTIVQF